MQPGIPSIKNKQVTIDHFKGLCLRSIVPNGYFSDSENLSASGYPALTTRSPRSTVNECSAITDMYLHNRIMWVENDKLYYGDREVGAVSPGRKQFASIGSRVVIYPDKLLVDTETFSLSPLEQVFEGTGVAVFSCDRSGAPAAETGYVGLACTGIGTGFRAGDGVDITGFTDEEGLNGSYVLQTVSADLLVIVAEADEGFTASGEITVSRSAPDLDFICALNNRIWGVSSAGNVLYACKLGDPTNWNCFEGISTDSYAASVTSPGAFTGMTGNLGNVILFKENEIIKVYGSKPSNFQLVSSRMPGICRGGARTLAYTDSTLFYLGSNGIYAYDGASPVMISEALGNTSFSAGCAGALDGKYYISMKNVSNNTWGLYVYDAQTGIWQKENGGNVRFIAETDSNLFIGLPDGKVNSVHNEPMWYSLIPQLPMRMSLIEHRFSWYAVSGAISLCTPNRQHISRLYLRLSLSSLATLSVSVRYPGNGLWTEIGSFTGPLSESTVALSIVPRRTDSIYLKLSGVDECAIHSLTWGYAEGSDF